MAKELTLKEAVAGIRSGYCEAGAWACAKKLLEWADEAARVGVMDEAELQASPEWARRFEENMDAARAAGLGEG